MRVATCGDSVEHVIVLERGSRRATLHAPRDVTWDEFLGRGDGHSGEHEVMESNEPAYILATSGTTARPKLAVHTHGGYQVHIASMGRWCFGLKPSDVWWATSDVGWIVGHSYMIYAPLLAGCTTVAFEGALDHPAPDAHWRAAVEELGVTGIFTSPTAVRLLRRYGEDTLGDVDHGRARTRRLRRRGPQSAGVGLAAEHGAQRTRAGHRPHVADGNGRTGIRQPVRHRAAADQAGLRGHPSARHRCGGRQPRWHALSAERERDHGPEAARSPA